MKELHAKIGQLAMENDFLAVALGRIDGSRGAGLGKLDKDISDKSALKYEGIRHQGMS